MMQPEDIRALIEAVDISSVQELEFANNEYKIRISKIDTPRPVVTQASLLNEAGSDVPKASIVAQQQLGTVEAPVAAPPVVEAAGQASEAAAKPAETSTGTIVKSPIVGVAYLAPAPDKPVYKKVGDTVAEGETLCIVEAMKLMNEIPATVSGKIGRIFVEDGEVVEFDQPLFEII